KLDRAVAALQSQQLSSRVEFAFDGLAVGLADDADRDAEFNFSVAGMQIHVGGEVFGDSHREPAVSGANAPVGHQPGTRLSDGLDPSVTGLHVERIKAPADANGSVAGLDFQCAVVFIDFDFSVSGVEKQIALGAVDLDGSVAGFGVNGAFDVIQLYFPVA